MSAETPITNSRVQELQKYSAEYALSEMIALSEQLESSLSTSDENVSGLESALLQEQFASQQWMAKAIEAESECGTLREEIQQARKALEWIKTAKVPKSGNEQLVFILALKTKADETLTVLSNQSALAALKANQEGRR